VHEVKQTGKKGIGYIAVIIISIAGIGLAASMSRAASPAAGGGDAKSVYDSKCASCHGRDGRAKSLHAKHEKARDLTTAEWQDSVSDERIYNSISNGKGKMPSFKKKLSDAQMDELVNYVRRLRR
jgi:mono/diheme cytochrome c family protein